MDFFNSVKGIISQNSVQLKKPDFYKSDSDAKVQLEQLKEFYKIAPSYVKSQVEQDIKMLAYGISGEENVAFELNNSYLPIIILHDLHIEYDGLSAQIDYMIITSKFSLIVECKNLIGNIEINTNGDFIRTTEYRGKYKKEGIYSPITQNTRHIDMIKKIRSSSKNNIILKTMFEKYFDTNYKSVVVLANPKTVINMKYAKKEIKDQIIKSDQLIAYIKKLTNESDNTASTVKQMYDLADFYIGMHTPNTTDYTRKYCFVVREGESEVKEDINHIKEIKNNKEVHIVESVKNIEDTPIYKDLKQYRYDKSTAERIKAYLVYNNAQMESLIEAMPNTIDNIKKISGFGEEKCKKYGQDILKIIKKYK